MNVPAKIALFAIGLTATFGVTAYVGSTVGPVITPSTGPTGDHSGNPGHGQRDTTGSGSAASVPGGLTTARDGYALRLTGAPVTAGSPQELRFVVTGPDGRPVTEYVPSHDKLLHLIVASRDLVEFHHVHPELAEDGTWSVELAIGGAGAHRVFADFKPAGHQDAITLGTDLLVAGEYSPAPLPPIARTSVVDGYTVTLDGALQPGDNSVLTATVTKDGEPVTDLEPYLGAYGHLVALRAGDLAYLHVHPDGAPGDGSTPPGPEVTFVVDVPTTGDYRLFLDFQHGGVLRTAAFTQSASLDGHTAQTHAPTPTVPTMPGQGDRPAGNHAPTEHTH